MPKETEWNKHFNIGIDSIDNAHRKLFSIVCRLIHLSVDENNGHWACAEGIKYFKTYATEHFMDEEAYMRSIGYEGYEIHKGLHDNMRYMTLPALERDLKESDYSQESIQHFLGICLGWLTAHIMIEDRAITGRVSCKRKTDKEGKAMGALEEALSDTIEEIFRLQTEIVSEHYSGEDFGESIIDRLVYRSEKGTAIQFFLVLEETLVLQTASAMLDMPLKKVDKLVTNAVRELSQNITEHIGTHFHLPSHYHLESNHVITAEQFHEKFHVENFDYSLLLNTGTGYFAFCIRSE